MPKIPPAELFYHSEIVTLAHTLDEHFYGGGNYEYEVGYETGKKNYGPEIDFNSTIIEVSNYYKEIEAFDAEYLSRSEIAPSKEIFLRNLITDIETEIETEGKTENEKRQRGLIRRAYTDITNGKNNYLNEYTGDLIQKVKKSDFIEFSDLRFIAKGVTYAYRLPSLKNELRQVTDFNEPSKVDIPPLNEKLLNWTGTPAQFGFIFEMLIQRGYLEKPSGFYSTDAKIYLQHFKIKTADGTLSKELSESTNSLTLQNRNKFKIPEKDILTSRK